MQANWDEKYLTQVGYVSHVNAGRKVPHSGETSHLGEMSHSYKQPPILSSHFQSKRINKSHKQEALSKDIDKYKIDICCLQETKVAEYLEKTTSHRSRLITIPSNS